MPRPKKERSVFAEANVRTRVKLMRVERGWTLDTLARKMTSAGVPMTRSTIYKIEQGDPPRTIDVNDLVGFATVFGVPVLELLSDPADRLTDEMLRLYDEWLAASKRADDLWERRQVEVEQAQQAREQLAALVTTDKQRKALLGRVKQQQPEWIPDDVVDHLLHPKEKFRVLRSPGAAHMPSPAQVRKATKTTAKRTTKPTTRKAQP